MSYQPKQQGLNNELEELNKYAALQDVIFSSSSLIVMVLMCLLVLLERLLLF